jgi:putative LysE/RhtB family amino acid efflux pump
MLFALLFGILVGFVLAMPPGPVAVMAMKLSLNKGMKPGILAATGTGLMDFIYFLFAVFATSGIKALVDHFFTDFPILSLLFQVVIIIAIMAYGYINIKNKDKFSAEVNTEDIGKKSKLAAKLSNKGPFLLGMGVAIANMANPTFIPSLIGVATYMNELSIVEITTLNNLMLSVGFGIGNFLWLYVIMRVLTHYKGRMSDQTLARIHQFAGFSLIGVGTLLGYKVVWFTKWSEIIRLAFAF